MGTFRTGAVLASATAACAIALNALCAHVALDVIGDFALRHDAYDDDPHGSRPALVALAAAAALTALVVVALAAHRELRGERGAFRAIVLGAVPRPGPLVLAAFAALTTLALAGMGALDGWLAGAPVDNLGDALGGSPLLAGTVIAVLTPLAARAWRRLAEALAASRAAVFAVVAGFLRLTPAAAPAPVLALDGAPRPLGARRSVLARRGGKRAPPRLLRSPIRI